MRGPLIPPSSIPASLRAQALSQGSYAEMEGTAYCKHFTSTHLMCGHELVDTLSHAHTFPKLPPR